MVITARCTDHEALKSLLNTPQPSGKLARWGMAIQELDIEILHRSGKHNANADALSRSPLGDSDCEQTPYGIISALEGEDLEMDLAALQRGDSELAAVVTYLETGVLPAEEKFAKRLALTQSQYVIEDGILYHVEADSTLRVIPREKLEVFLVHT